MWGNPIAEAVAPLAEKYHVPMLAMALSPEVSKNKRYVIRSGNHSALFANCLAEHIRATGYSRIGVVLTENSYLIGMYAELQRALGSEVTLDVIARYDASENDFRSAISKLKIRDYDAIAVFLMSGQVSQFYRQYAEQKLSLPTLGTDFFESATEIRFAGAAIQGAVYAHLGASPAFYEEYVSLFNDDLQLAYAGNGYDMAKIIAQALLAAGPTTDADRLIATLRSSSDYHGVLGIAHYRETEEGGAYFELPIELKRVTGTSFVTIPSAKSPIR